MNVEIMSLADANYILSQKEREFAGYISIADPPLYSGMSSLRPHDLPQGDRTLCLEFHDVNRIRPMLRAPTLTDGEKVLQLGRDVRGDERSVLIHCMQGMSRSTAVALGLLLLDAPRTEEAVQKAWEEILRQRPEATPNILLCRIFDRLLGYKRMITRVVRGDG